MAISKTSVSAANKFDAVFAGCASYDHQHALAILTFDFPKLFAEICDVISEASAPAKGKLEPPRAISRRLTERGWQRRELSVRFAAGPTQTLHKACDVDLLKQGVAFGFATDEVSECERVYKIGREVLRRDRPAVRLVMDLRQYSKSDLSACPAQHGASHYDECPTLLISAPARLRPTE